MNGSMINLNETNKKGINEAIRNESNYYIQAIQKAITITKARQSNACNNQSNK